MTAGDSRLLMLPARSRSGDRTPFADTDFSKARGVHHHSRPSSSRSLENRAVAAIWDYCATKTGSVVVSSSGAVEDDAGFNESSKNSISIFWIHSQHERNRIELTPNTGGVKVFLYGDIRELTSPKPSPEGIKVEVRIRTHSASNQDRSEDQPEDAHKSLEGVFVMNECLPYGWLQKDPQNRLQELAGGVQSCLRPAGSKHHTDQ